MIYAIVAAVFILDAAAARREQRAGFALAYRQARRCVGAPARALARALIGAKLQTRSFGVEEGPGTGGGHWYCLGDAEGVRRVQRTGGTSVRASRCVSSESALHIYACM